MHINNKVDSRDPLTFNNSSHDNEAPAQDQKGSPRLALFLVTRHTRVTVKHVTSPGHASTRFVSINVRYILKIRRQLGRLTCSRAVSSKGLLPPGSYTAGTKAHIQALCAWVQHTTVHFWRGYNLSGVPDANKAACQLKVQPRTTSGWLAGLLLLTVSWNELISSRDHNQL